MKSIPVVDENPKAKSKQRAAMLFSLAKRSWDALVGALQSGGPMTEAEIVARTKLHPRLVNAALWLGTQKHVFKVEGGPDRKSRTYEARQMGLPIR